MGCYSLLQGIFPDPGTEPRCSARQADSSPSEPPGKPHVQGISVEKKCATTRDCVLQLEDAELTRTSEGRQVASGWPPSQVLGLSQAAGFKTSVKVWGM